MFIPPWHNKDGDSQPSQGKAKLKKTLLQEGLETATKIKKAIQLVIAEYGQIKNNVKHQKSWAWGRRPGNLDSMEQAFDKLDELVSKDQFLSKLMVGDAKALKKEFSEAELTVKLQQIGILNAPLENLQKEVRKVLSLHTVYDQ